MKGSPSSSIPFKFEKGEKIEPPKFPDPTSKAFEEQAVKKDMKEEAQKRLREFEKTTLKELGEDGWTLRSVNEVNIIPDMTTFMYYFSRPL